MLKLNVVSARLVQENPGASAPGQHDNHKATGDCQGHPSTLMYFKQIGAEKNQIDQHQGTYYGSRDSGSPSPRITDGQNSEGRGHDHRAGNGNAICGGQSAGR